MQRDSQRKRRTDEMFVFPSGNCLTPGCLPSPRLSINPFCTSASHSKRMCGLIWVCLCHIMFDVWYWWLIPIKGVTGQWSGLASALPSPCPCPCLYPCLYYRPRAPLPGLWFDSRAKLGRQNGARRRRLAVAIKMGRQQIWNQYKSRGLDEPKGTVRKII